MAGLVPAIPIHVAQPCPPKRDRRDKPGDDSGMVVRLSIDRQDDDRLGRRLPSCHAAEIFQHVHERFRLDFHAAGERVVDHDHRQQRGKDQRRKRARH